MNKRRFLLTLAPALLAGCGFRLRGVPTFAFRSLYIQASAGSSLARELRRTLQGAGGSLIVVTDEAQKAQAEVVLDLLSERNERVVVSLNSAGQVRELQLRLRVRFRLRDAQGRGWIEETELLQQRDVSYNESVALSKEGEEALLQRNMQTDMVQQLLRRLAAAHPPAAAAKQ
ncbi:hypothetical protein GCM10022279_06180 [Comamonas faecalis]|uniref:LPS-assembly lipoprotein LptE n=1 Tax=Comamonas faecalis TaxID=1387849 RepID=A0ABP7QNY5_9BURK